MNILLVEDDASLQLVTKDFLEDNGYTVEVCASGSRALELFKEKEYHLVVLDINLPDLLGFDVCSIIRKTSKVPIIFLSARISDMDKIRGLDIGADDYIMKPYSLNELLYRIKAQIRRKYDYDDAGSISEGSVETLGARSDGQQGTFSFGKVIVDFDSRRVSVGGEYKELPPKEFELLALFIKNRNKSITKELLYNSIWGMDSMGEINTLSVHIRRLREKIEEDPSNPRFLKTVWGVGFRFEV